MSRRLLGSLLGGWLVGAGVGALTMYFLLKSENKLGRPDAAGEFGAAILGLGLFFLVFGGVWAVQSRYPHPDPYNFAKRSHYLPPGTLLAMVLGMLGLMGGGFLGMKLVDWHLVAMKEAMFVTAALGCIAGLSRADVWARQDVARRYSPEALKAIEDGLRGLSGSSRGGNVP